MRSYVALLVGPLGAKNGRLVYESRELVGQTPAAFVKVAFLWLLVRAILMTMQARVGSSIVGHFPNRGAFVPDLVSGVIGLVLVMFVGGWLSLWALHRSGATYLSEPRVFTLRPGIWAGLATLNCLGAAGQRSRDRDIQRRARPCHIRYFLCQPWIHGDVLRSSQYWHALRPPQTFALRVDGFVASACVERRLDHVGYAVGTNAESRWLLGDGVP